MTTKSVQPSPRVDCRLNDGSFLIWGTADVEEATRLLLTWDEIEEYLYCDEEFDYDVEPVFEVNMVGVLKKCVERPEGDDGWTVRYSRWKTPCYGANYAVVLEFAGWQEVGFLSDADIE